jgi:hypothetical protein
MFVDENTLKYQSVIKKMEGNKSSKGSGSGSNSGETESEDEELKEQTTVITTNVKHVGKGVIIQSYDISDDSDGNDDGGNYKDYNVSMKQNKVTMTNIAMNKKIVYKEDKNIDVDDI